MDHFKLLRDFWDFAFENPELISPNHCALYCFIINHSNRLGQKRKLGLPSGMAKEAIGIKCYKSYIKTLKDLVSWGFIELLEKSKNQYSSNIIALVFNDKATTKAYDKAMLMQATKQVQSTTQSPTKSNYQSTHQSNTTIDKLITNKEELITKRDMNEIFSAQLLESDSWLESIFKLNKWLPNEESKKRVAKWLLEFNIKLSSELDVKFSPKDYGSHFSRWLPGEVAKQKRNNVSDLNDSHVEKMIKPKFLPYG